LKPDAKSWNYNVLFPETKEPSLHIGDFTIRKEVRKTIESERARNKKEN
jgi:hypothetical protein